MSALMPYDPPNRPGPARPLCATIARSRRHRDRITGVQSVRDVTPAGKVAAEPAREHPRGRVTRSARMPSASSSGPPVPAGCAPPAQRSPARPGCRDRGGNVPSALAPTCETSPPGAFPPACPMALIFPASPPRGDRSLAPAGQRQCARSAESFGIPIANLVGVPLVTWMARRSAGAAAWTVAVDRPRRDRAHRARRPAHRNPDGASVRNVAPFGSVQVATFIAGPRLRRDVPVYSYVCPAHHRQRRPPKLVLPGLVRVRPRRPARQRTVGGDWPIGRSLRSIVLSSLAMAVGWSPALTAHWFVAALS